MENETIQKAYKNAITSFAVTIDPWILEVNVHDKTLHIDKLSRILKMNAQLFTDSIMSDYAIIGMFQTMEDAQDAANTLTKSGELT